MPINRAYIEKLILDIRRSMDAVVSLTAKPYGSMTEVEKYAVGYHLIVIAEALIAMVVHVARRVFNEEVESPIHALRVLRDRGLILGEEYSDLLSFLKLRNLLVHRYWIIDDGKIYDSVKGDFKSIVKLLERVAQHVG